MRGKDPQIALAGASSWLHPADTSQQGAQAMGAPGQVGASQTDSTTQRALVPAGVWLPPLAGGGLTSPEPVSCLDGGAQRIAWGRSVATM